MTQRSNDLQIRRGAALLEAEVDGEMVGLSVKKGTCYGFNRTAYRIWQIAERPVRLSELCALLSQEFEIDADICEKEVRPVLDALAADGLLELSET